MSYNLERVYLFSPSIFKTRIDPSTYDKDIIVADVEQNYNISPFRNKWGDIEAKDNWHHTYGDEENSMFRKINFDKVNVEYAKIISDFVKRLDLMTPVNYHYRIANVTASKNIQSMKVHNHLTKIQGTNSWCSFNGIHYISFKKGHSGTKVLNPSMFAQYFKTFEHMAGLVNLSNPDNTEHHDVATITPREDDFVIMPSYLNHGVDGTTDNKDDLRITVVINIWFEKKEEIINE